MRPMSILNRLSAWRHARFCERNISNGSFAQFRRNQNIVTYRQHQDRPESLHLAIDRFLDSMFSNLGDTLQPIGEVSASMNLEY